MTRNSQLHQVIVYCKNCIHRKTRTCPMYDLRYNSYLERLEETDNTWNTGFCQLGEKND